MAIIILAGCRGVINILQDILKRGQAELAEGVQKWLKWCQVAQTRAKAPQTGSQWKWRLGRISRLKTGKSASQIILILLQRLSSRLLARSIKIILTSLPLWWRRISSYFSKSIPQDFLCSHLKETFYTSAFTFSVYEYKIFDKYIPVRDVHFVN